MKENSKKDGMDNLLIIMELLRKSIPNDLTDCRDIDYETLSIPFERMSSVNYHLSVNQKMLSFVVSDGQFYKAGVNVSIMNGEVFIYSFSKI